MFLILAGAVMLLARTSEVRDRMIALLEGTNTEDISIRIETLPLEGSVSLCKIRDRKIFSIT